MFPSHWLNCTVAIRLITRGNLAMSFYTGEELEEALEASLEVQLMHTAKHSNVFEDLEGTR